MCSERHLTVLAAYAVKHGLSGSTQINLADQLKETFRTLRDANADALDALYGKDNQGDRLLRPKEPAYHEKLDAVTLLKACRFYSYQTCESRTYKEGGRAYTIIQDIERHLVAHLPGYDAAPWGL
jgi:hypothetical protein